MHAALFSVESSANCDSGNVLRETMRRTVKRAAGETRLCFPACVFKSSSSVSASGIYLRGRRHRNDGTRGTPNHHGRTKG